MAEPNAVTIDVFKVAQVCSSEVSELVSGYLDAAKWAGYRRVVRQEGLHDVQRVQYPRGCEASAVDRYEWLIGRGVPASCVQLGRA